MARGNEIVEHGDPARFQQVREHVDALHDLADVDEQQ
jgi:hypothetical protein